MKYKCIVYFIGALFTATISYGADSFAKELPAIKKHYQEVNEIISNCEKLTADDVDSDNCPYYRATLLENVQNKPMAAVGIWQQKTDFWYYYSEDLSPIIVKITQKTNISAATEYYEYLFDAQGLVFYFAKLPLEDIEKRLYFVNNKLIKAVPKEAQEDAKEILQKAEKLKNIVL